MSYGNEEERERKGKKEKQGKNKNGVGVSKRGVRKRREGRLSVTLDSLSNSFMHRNLSYSSHL